MPTSYTGDSDHDSCVADVVSELMNDGYVCYLEYEIPLEGKKMAVVDIYAVRGSKELIVEVGTLSPQHGDRIPLLKLLMPNAKIVWVHQWKNYFSIHDYDKEYWKWRVERWAFYHDKDLYRSIVTGVDIIA